MLFRSLCLAALLQLALLAGASAQEARKVAFFGFELINSSMEPTSAEETARIGMLNDLFRDKLTASGKYEIIEIPADALEKLAAGPEIHNCNGCELDVARAAGADISAWGTVQKVSNLILNINIYLTTAESGEPYFTRSVDIRGNTDESWRRGLDYMLRNYLLKKP
jgi:hypothetical protein